MNVRPSRTRALALLLICCAPLAPAAGTDGAHGRDARVMLPADVTPERYRIEVSPDAAAAAFTGTVEIDLAVHQATETLVLNSADIVIDRAELPGAAAAVTAIRYDPREQTAILSLDRRLVPGSAMLKLAYHGRIYQQASGLFSLVYQTPQGKAHALFTQFENSDARRFVPCWDEPGRKAVFQLTAIVPADLMAVSNMPIEASEPLADGLKRVRFAATPRMSSYLLFFALGDFERVHREVAGTDLAVVVKRGDTAAAAFALDAAAAILPYYNDYFGSAFPLPKLDLIAAPGSSQFFGAMENWGAIFYFERDLLVDPRISTERDRRNVYIVVAHEMAHQWFGDLVTMAWWDDLWLNEGFASWMENKVTDHFHPEWQIWLQTLRATDSAMEEDARDGTHPIVTPILDVQQANDAFDTITYTKGAAVIRMLEAYVGEDAFRAGVRRYMHEHAYGNTVTDDLWRAMDRDSPRPITRIAHDFTLQSGVPLLREGDSPCRSDTRSVTVSQQRYAIDAARDRGVWHLPVRVADARGATVTRVVSGPRPQAIELPACDAVVLNAGQTAYFRSRYSAAGLAAVAARFGSLSPYDELGILNDTRALAFAGEESMAAPLDLTQRLPAETDPVVAAAVVSLLRRLDGLYDGLPGQGAFRAYASGVLRPSLARIGWSARAGDGDNTDLLRASVLEALGQFGDATVIAEARRRFDRYLSDPASLGAGERRAVLNVVAMTADQATWDRLHGLAKSAASELERQEYYDLLALPENVDLVRQALEVAVSGEPPPTLAPDIVSTAADRHPALAGTFAIAHWETLQPLIEPASQSRFVPALLAEGDDDSLIPTLEEFARHNMAANDRRELDKAEANIRYRAAVRKQRLPEVDAWIANQG